MLRILILYLFLFWLYIQFFIQTTKYSLFFQFLSNSFCCLGIGLWKRKEKKIATSTKYTKSLRSIKCKRKAKTKWCRNHLDAWIPKCYAVCLFVYVNVCERVFFKHFHESPSRIQAILLISTHISQTFHAGMQGTQIQKKNCRSIYLIWKCSQWQKMYDLSNLWRLLTSTLV